MTRFATAQVSSQDPAWHNYTKLHERQYFYEDPVWLKPPRCEHPEDIMDHKHRQGTWSEATHYSRSENGNNRFVFIPQHKVIYGN